MGNAFILKIKISITLIRSSYFSVLQCAILLSQRSEYVFKIVHCISRYFQKHGAIIKFRNFCTIKYRSGADCIIKMWLMIHNLFENTIVFKITIIMGIKKHLLQSAPTQPNPTTVDFRLSKLIVKKHCQLSEKGGENGRWNGVSFKSLACP